MLSWMGYVVFNGILVTELNGMALLKTTQTYGTGMKTFEVRWSKWKHLKLDGQNENTS